MTLQANAPRPLKATSTRQRAIDFILDEAGVQLLAEDGQPLLSEFRSTENGAAVPANNFSASRSKNLTAAGPKTLTARRVS